VLPWAALVMSLVALGGSLYLSMGLHLRACPLCFYQRTFAMSLVAVLGTGLILHGGRELRVSLLALPLATGGLGVALFHVFLELKGTLECPAGALAAGSAPQQSLVAFIALFAILLADVILQRTSWVAMGSTIVLGGALAVASLIANPPPPPAPTQPYPGAPDICRPPYHAPSS
jgi:disulfide bond formation protein DsbB